MGGQVKFVYFRLVYDSESFVKFGQRQRLFVAWKAQVEGESGRYYNTYSGTVYIMRAIIFIDIINREWQGRKLHQDRSFDKILCGNLLYVRMDLHTKVDIVTYGFLHNKWSTDNKICCYSKKSHFIKK